MAKKALVEVGKTYDLVHCRKGKLRLKVTIVSEEWIDGILLNEDAVRGIHGESKWFPGEKMTVRNVLCRLI